MNGSKWKLNIDKITSRVSTIFKRIFHPLGYKGNEIKHANSLQLKNSLKTCDFGYLNRLL